MSERSARRGVKALILTLVGCIGLSAGVASLYIFVIDPYLAWLYPRGGVDELGDDPPTPFVMPVIQHPPVHSAQEAKLDDDEMVIGVEVDGQFRAYSVKVLSQISQHVVNDVIGDRPITVTHCDKTECTRVLTDHNGKEPLNVAIGGWDGDDLLLMIGDRFFNQTKDRRQPIPYPDHPFEIMTWKAWREAHPETELFEGTTDDTERRTSRR